MCKSVVGENPKEKINLYADEYYHFHNIRGLISFYKDKPEPDRLRGYILDAAAEDNIYRILGDFVSYGIGGGFSYFISFDIYNLLLENNNDLTSKLDELLDKRPAETESEKLVLEIYKGRETVNREIDGRGTVLRPEIFHFDL